MKKQQAISLLKLMREARNRLNDAIVELQAWVDSQP